MKRKMPKWLKSQAGETISEVLIALLISSIALVMLASMISATNSMVGKSNRKMEEYYSKNENLENIHVSAMSTSSAIITISGDSINVPPTTVPYIVNDAFAESVYAYDIPTSSSVSP